MKITTLGFLITAVCILQAPTSNAAGPEAARRTYAENYKDMVMATCLTTAYRQNREISKDVGSSISALIEWTYYDMDKSPDAVNALVNKYLSRDYYNPIVESEVKGVRFDYLKCLDLYHSDELNSLVNHIVYEPQHTYIQDTEHL